jgi:hypothetical protein
MHETTFMSHVSREVPAGMHSVFDFDGMKMLFNVRERVRKIGIAPLP